MIGIGISPSLLNYKLGGFLLDSLEGDARAIFSIRRLLTSYTGDLVRLRRDSDHAESDFGPDANGDLDTAAITTWLGGANGFVVTWYDQSGNGYDAAQSTAVNQPQYIASGINSKPIFRNNPSGNGDKLIIPDEAFRSLSAATYCVVSEVHGIGYAQFGLHDIDNLEYGGYIATPTANSMITFWFGSTSETRTSDNYTFTDPHIYICKSTNGAFAHIYVDGTEANYNKTANGVTTPASFTRDGAIGQMDDTRGSHDADTDFAEIILLASALSDADRNAIEADQSTYFNI